MDDKRFKNLYQAFKSHIDFSNYIEEYGLIDIDLSKINYNLLMAIYSGFYLTITIDPLIEKNSDNDVKINLYLEFLDILVKQIAKDNGTIKATIEMKTTGEKVENEITISGIDVTGPNLKVHYFKDDTSWGKTKTIEIVASDLGSGLLNKPYSYDGGKTWTKYDKSNGKSPFTTTNFTKERNSLVYIRVCDKLGNCSSSNNTYIRIDKTKPTCKSSKSNLNTTSGVIATFSCSDSGSGVSCTPTKTGLKSSQLYTIKDKAGNIGICIGGYYSCQDKSCGCASVVRCEQAGCENWSNWSNWSDSNSNYCNNSNSCQGNIRVVYY